jgi:hypothetical protein
LPQRAGQELIPTAMPRSSAFQSTQDQCRNSVIEARNQMSVEVESISGCGHRRKFYLWLRAVDHIYQMPQPARFNSI